MAMPSLDSRKRRATEDVLVQRKRQSGVKQRRLDIQFLYTLGKELGRGSFAVTRSCKHKVTGETYACKSISKRGRTREELEAVQQEVEIMQRFAGEHNIIQLRDVCEDADSIYLVMEHCEGGELFDAVNARREGHYSEQEAAYLCRQVLEGIQTCHSAGVIHADIKLENILFMTKETKFTSPIRLIDFGASSFVTNGKSFQKAVGSLMYMAPEVWRQSYGTKADIWSLGVVLYVLLCGEYPFQGRTDYDLKHAVLNAEIDFSTGRWLKISDQAKNLVKQLLQRDPSKRLAAQEVLSHPWVQGRVV